MRKLLVIAGLLFSIASQAQVGELFGGTANVFVVDDNTGPVFRFRAFFNDASGRWAGDSTQVGDQVFVFSGNKVYKLTVDSVLSASTIVNLRVRDSTATLASFPTGVCALMRVTDNNQYPATIPGLPNVLGSKITTYFAEQAENASGSGTGVTTGVKGDINVVGADSDWQIVNNAVGTNEIAVNAVTTGKIADANVTTAKLVDTSITTAKIRDLNVTTAKLNDLAVTTGKLADDGVTNAKLDTMAANTIKGNLTGSSANPTDNTIASLRTALTIEDSTSNKLVVPSLTSPYFLFATGSRTATTANSYLSKAAGALLIDAGVGFRFGSWITGNRPASPGNGEFGYNSTLHLPDVYVNGAWRNMVVSNGALTAGGVPYIDASGHLAYDAGLEYLSTTNALKINAPITTFTAPLMVKMSGSYANGITIRDAADSFNAAIILNGRIQLQNTSGDIGMFQTGGTGWGSNPSTVMYTVTTNSRMLGIFPGTGVGSSDPGVKIGALSSTASGTTAKIVTIESEHSPSFGGGATAGTGSISMLTVDGVFNQTASDKNINSIVINPTLTAVRGTYTAFDIIPTLGIGIRQRSTTPTNRFAGDTRFGADTAPTAEVDITGRLKVSVRDSTTSAVEVAAWTTHGTATKVTIGPNLTLTGGVLDAVAGLSEITGMCVDTVAQTAHGFVLGDIIYWTGSAYADFIGTTGDTITPSGVVTESITANSFSYATCGIIDNDFSLPDGLYYATGAGFNLVPDTLQIPIIKVEGAKSTVITPVPYSDEVGTVELFSIVTDTGTVVVYGGDSFDLPEAIRSDELGAETSSTPTTAAKFTIHLVDCTSGVREVDTPASPVAGDWFAVSDSRSNAGTNNITIDTSTDKLGGAAVDYVMNVNGQFARFTYVNSTIGWIKSN